MTVLAPLHNLCYNTLIVHFQNALFEMMFAEDTIFDVVGKTFSNFLLRFVFKIEDYGSTGTRSLGGGGGGGGVKNIKKSGLKKF
jgi:hypothetical protein